MNELRVFSSEEFGEVRTEEIDGKIYFCAKDVTKALGYANANATIKRHCKKDGVSFQYPIDNLGRKQETKFIDEGNLYRLIAHSKLESAKRFEAWIFEEVLPTIRRNGAYMTKEIIEKVITNPDFLIELLSNLKKEREEKRKLEIKIDEDKPKVLFADAVNSSKTSILIGDLAKILKQNGFETGQKRLFELLRVKGYLIKSGASKNMPTQHSMELGLFEIKETVVNNPDGSVRVTKTTKVTGKGQQYFISKFLDKAV